MEEKDQMKILLRISIIVIAVILILAIIALGSIWLKPKKSDTEENITKIEEKEIKDYNDNNEVCTIKGNGSNVLYKNEYESDLSYAEKIIYIDNNAKDNMTSSFKMNANQVLYTGVFNGEFIKIGYDANQCDYEMCLAYIEDRELYNCKMNKLVKKALNQNGKEVEIPKLNFDEDTADIPSDLSTLYALFDITTKEDEDYIVGMYNGLFSEENENILSIIIVLKKENAKIDINNNEQVKRFWDKYADYEIEEVEEENQKDYEELDIDGTTYYHRLTENKWQGEYHQETYKTAQSNNMRQVISYDDYIKYIDEINNNIDDKEISNYYTDDKSNYIILSYANGNSWCEMELIDCIEENNNIIIYGDEEVHGVMADGSGYFIAIPTNMPAGTEVIYRECYSTSEISNLKNYGSFKVEYTVDKPIIYLYPTKDTKVNVKLGNAELATCLYPKYDYENGWNVLAKTTGELVNLDTNKKLYSLYYESKAINNFKVQEDGFIVKGSEAANFLEEKLAILGLTDREAEEFIIYWLPKLESNKYNYIRFATQDEINANMPLEITPKPDNIIRVLMTFKGLDNPISVKEQQLITPERTGFTVVEWGGSEIK